MSDIASSQPIRSEADGTDQRVHVKIVDGLTPTQMATVDTDHNVHIEMHGNSATGNTDVVQLLTEEGRSTTRGDYNATTNTKPSSNATIIHPRGATLTEANQTFRPSGVVGTDGLNAHAQDVSLLDQSGNAFTADNPLNVTLVPSPGSEVNDYATGAALAAGATINHDYTVTTAKRLKLSQIVAAASGKLKIEVQVETATNVFASKFVGFNSTSSPNILIPVNENITLAAALRVRIILTNKDLLPQDVYSTICGHEIT